MVWLVGSSTAVTMEAPQFGRHGTVSSRTLLDLMLARMQRDYEALAPKGRKAGSLKDLDTYLN